MLRRPLFAVLGLQGGKPCLRRLRLGARAGRLPAQPAQKAAQKQHPRHRRGRRKDQQDADGGAVIPGQARKQHAQRRPNQQHRRARYPQRLPDMFHSVPFLFAASRGGRLGIFEQFRRHLLQVFSNILGDVVGAVVIDMRRVAHHRREVEIHRRDHFRAV